MSSLPPPLTPPRLRTNSKTTTRLTSTTFSYSSIASSPPKPSSLSLSSSSPAPHPLRVHPASVGAPIKHAHFVEQDEDEDEEDGSTSPTEEAKREWRRGGKSGRRGMSRSEGQENDAAVPSSVPASSSAKKQQSRRATFSKVVSSGRTTLVGLGQPQSTGKVSTPPRTGSYVPPHQRRPSLSSSTSTPYQPVLNSYRNPLAAFDRSACPEPEDSFYTNVSNLSLGGIGISGGAGSPTSTAFSTPASSRMFSPAGAKPSPLSFLPGHSTPFHQQYQAPPPLSPTTLLSRGPYVDPLRFAHPRAIPEEDDEIEFVGPSTSGGRTAPVPVETLDYEEEAALASGEYGDEYGEEQVELRFGMGARRRSSAFVNSPGLPQDAVPDDACSGCGTEKNAAFVELLPCHHLVCHVCVNALINGAAHKPPRPTDCFACTNFVETFMPAFPTSTSFTGAAAGGVGLVLALKEVLFHERGKETNSATGRGRRRSIVSSTGGDEAENDLDLGGGKEVKITRTRRRRSSVVAAAIAATLLGVDNTSEEGEVKKGHSRTSTMESFRSLTSLPSSVAEEDSFSGGGSSHPLKKGDFPPSSSSLSSRRQSHASPATIASTSSNLKLPHFDASSVPPAIDWPVVRLDNVPWEVTAAEVEQWAGEENLASELDDDEQGEVGKGQGQVGRRVTLAVHILCNRADGRTLNQAFLECSSSSAARALVRSKDGSKLRGRPVHVSLTGQGEFLTTLFPTYTPGFSSLEPNPNPRSKWAAPIPLLLQTELTGLLNLCRVDSAHARKVPERPYFNLVTLLEKMPWSFPTYNSQAVVRLFNTVCAAIEILGSIKRSVPAWKDILTVMVDAILHCPVFRPQQKQKAVRIATSIGFDHVGSSSAKSLSSTPSKPLIRGPAAISTSSFIPSSLREKFVGTAPDQALLAAKQADGTFVDDSQLVEVGLPSPRFGFERTAAGEGVEEEGEPTSPTTAGGNTVVPRHHRRRSSIAAQLNIDKALVESVAAALGISLEPSPSAAARAE